MNGLAEKQLLEFVVMVGASIAYVILHYACNGLAIALSGQKNGIIRGFLQGIMLCGVFALVAVFMLNGDIKWYHVFCYLSVVLLLFKAIKATKNIAKKNKKEKINGDF